MLKRTNEIPHQRVGLNITPVTDVRVYLFYEQQVPREVGWAKIKLYKTYANIFQINIHSH